MRTEEENKKIDNIIDKLKNKNHFFKVSYLADLKAHINEFYGDNNMIIQSIANEFIETLFNTRNNELLDKSKSIVKELTIYFDELLLTINKATEKDIFTQKHISSLILKKVKSIKFDTLREKIGSNIEMALEKNGLVLNDQLKTIHRVIKYMDKTDNTPPIHTVNVDILNPKQNKEDN